MTDRVAVITGAGGELGRVLAQRFAEQGVRLALINQETESLAEFVAKLGLADDGYMLIEADLTDAEQVRTAVAEVVDKFGKVDILAHLVGGYTGGKSVVEADPDELASMLQQHVWTTFHVAQAVVPHLVDKGWGRVVAVSHRDALTPPGNNSPYAIAKAGQEVLMQSLAQELKGTGVTSNVVLVRSIDVKRERLSDPSPKNASKTTPEEIASAILYLCSDEASIVNGARIPLYGQP